MPDPAMLASRAYFPRGLSQPKTGFRFSLDALLLAAFARPSKGPVLDLGTGCGVVGLAWALIHPDSFVLGLDNSQAMLEHAQSNVRRLALGERVAFLYADVTGPASLSPECMDLVLCNPPYRPLDTGRVCVDVQKSKARFECGAVLADFVRYAAFVLRNKKSCAFVYLAERVDELLELLRTHRLQPKDVLFVHPQADSRARLVLLRAIKNGGPGLRVAAPLILHGDHGLSAQALEFCPFLACNSSKPLTQ